jgi:hypothetical protein
LGCVERGEANFLSFSELEREEKNKIKKFFFSHKQPVEKTREKQRLSASLRGKKKVIIIVKRVRAKGNEEFELCIKSPVNSWQDLVRRSLTDSNYRHQLMI